MNQIRQGKLADGSSDKTWDCEYCRLHNPDRPQRCSGRDRPEHHRCERCGHCNTFEPITEEDVKKAGKKAEEIYERVNLTRWKWRRNQNQR